jgi:hypothetical protein
LFYMYNDLKDKNHTQYLIFFGNKALTYENCKIKTKKIILFILLEKEFHPKKSF